MSKQGNPKQSGLGGNPLTQGLFSRTAIEEEPTPVPEKPKKVDSSSHSIESISKNIQSSSQNIESISKNLESRFLVDIENSSKESIGLQLTLEVNDWLDGLVKVGRRKYGKKIPKQTWIQAGVELLKAMPIDWTEMEDLDALRSQLSEIVSSLEEGTQ